MRTAFTLLLFLVVFGVKAEDKNDYSAVDKLALKIPEAQTKSVSGISDYINSKFSTPNDKTRAAFIWIATNIGYDVENMSPNVTYKDSQELIDKVLKTRKGVCMHFAELFSAITNQCGIKTLVISGYTKQLGKVDHVPHAWCASLIEDTWFLFDPTWGSGYLIDSKFVHQINNQYFKVKPEELIKSHIPFDPLWQFLSNPLTNKEFYEGKASGKSTAPLFMFMDSLKVYEQSSEIEKLTASFRRVQSNGVVNQMIFDRLQNIRQQIETYQYNQTIRQYNNAVNTYNEGVKLLNQFIIYRNNQFNPKKEDQEIQQMVELTEQTLLNSREQLAQIKVADQNTNHSINQLNGLIHEAHKNVIEQQAFLDKYFSTGKLQRKSLFYKYIWLGVPVNK